MIQSQTNSAQSVRTHVGFSSSRMHGRGCRKEISIHGENAARKNDKCHILDQLQLYEELNITRAGLIKAVKS